jgi:signal peptidase I
MAAQPDPQPRPRVVRRWPAVLLSLLIPGAGIFFGGNRRAGVYWFLGLNFLGYLAILAESQSLYPGLGPFVVLCFVYLVMSIWMLVRSFRPLDRLRPGQWTVVVMAGIACWIVSGAATDRLSRPFRFPTGSMQPTLMRGDRVFVEAVSYWFRFPRRGDIVVFKTDYVQPSSLPRGQFYAKRVAAVAGEKVQIQQGRLVINGQPLRGAGVLGSTNFWAEHIALLKTESEVFLVPSNACFVVGDNPTNSYDSRHYGAIPYAGVIGRVTKIYWPPSRAGDVR